MKLLSPDHPLSEFWFVFKQNKGAVIGLYLIIALICIAVLAPVIAPHQPAEVFDKSFRVSPIWTSEGTSQFILGTDDVGRDVLSRLIYGARISISVGLLVVLFSFIFGVSLGLLAGYKGGWVETLIMRCMDIIMALPSILLAIVIVAILGPSLLNAVVAVSIVKLPSFVRQTRASVISEKSKDYVTASRVFGASPWRQVFFNILPNCMAPIFIQATMAFSDGILDVAALGFLGLGAQPPTPEWGTMLADAKAYIQVTPWLAAFPGLCILVSVLSFNLFGDGLRDAFDPKLRK